ncbi:helix-turn-helix transcriptional regulator [Actinotignum sanguinis]|uniref:helix-turn-helix transcriptional regulator n=1 Tax=Actinotignum TaxID=1653174 RepID=UPI00254CA67D|nr:MULTISPECIES: helix-turn-helix transcriptional regulator [Actinotignum]MDK7198376.1 helix-turn-helix transcriptional regulator [Actinotignum sanguinis]MDY5158019.1 helix-turn-helix transcriptional regulator [Actinotignum timonense]
MDNNIPELRKQRGWSQEKLASILGVSRQTIISIEKGRFDPSLPLAFSIASVFERKIEDIFTPDTDPNPSSGTTLNSTSR